MLNLKLIFIVLLFFAVSASKPEKRLNEFEQSSNLIALDTNSIHRLFEQGNQFLNGPSDSLVFYYVQALEIIQEGLKQTPFDSTGKKSFYKTLRFLEFRALIELGIEHFFQADFESAIANNFEALEIALEFNNANLLSECYSEIGIIYKNQGKYDTALIYCEKAFYYASLGNDSSWIASCQINIGNVYKKKTFFGIALTHYLDALTILEQLENDKRIAACFVNIGDIYSKQLDYNKALEYYSRALQLAKSTNDKVRQTTCYINIGFVYANKKNFSEARQFYNLAFDLFQQSGYQHELDHCNILMGDTYMHEDNPSDALKFYNIAFELTKKESDSATLAEVHIKMGRAYSHQGNYSKALSLAEKGLRLSLEYDQLDLIITAHEVLSEIYNNIGLPDKALEEYKIYTFYKDSLFNVDKYMAITEMEMKYKTEKREKEVVVLKGKNEVQQLKFSRRTRLYLASLILIALLAGLAYILFRNHRLTTSHRAVELEQKLMLSQMNPHFIFNSLIAIQSYIYKQEPVIAGDYLAKFADLIRITLENSRSDFVSFEKEVRMLKVYLELQKLRYEDKFDFDINISSELDISTLMIPPMMAQPFIENAIEHGLRFKSTKGKLEISFVPVKNALKCSIYDNGVGREKARELEKNRKHNSMATGITKERLEILSKKFRQKFEFHIDDLKNEHGDADGTFVWFILPFRDKV